MNRKILKKGINFQMFMNINKQIILVLWQWKCYQLLYK